MRLRLYHTTHYNYPSPAMDSHNEVRLMPLSDSEQTCLDFRLTTAPATPIFAYDLPTGRVHHFDIRAPHRELSIVAESLVVTHHHDPFQGLNLTEDDSAFYRQATVQERFSEYLAPTERVLLHPETERIAAVARKQAGIGSASFLVALTRLLYRVIAYTPGATTVNSSIQHVLEQKSGVCQDFAHLMLAVCRRQHIPARYVSGYLYTGGRVEDYPMEIPEEGETPHPAASLRTNPTGGDAMHAWVECLLPDGKWHGFDPTNNLLTNQNYVKVHYGRDYGDVPPLRGIYRGPLARSMDVAVRVLREQ